MRSAFKKLSINKHNIDAGLLFAVTLCAIISTLLIYSIVESGLGDDEGVGASYWKTQLISTAAGLFAAIFISLMDYRKLVKLWFIFAPAALGLVALTFTSLGYQRSGADDQAWIRIAGFNLQPSEVLKLAFILTFSYHLSRDEEDMNKPALKPSYDFIQQLFTMNAHIEVLEPISLREKMKGLLEEMLSKY